MFKSYLLERFHDTLCQALVNMVSHFGVDLHVHVYIYALSTEHDWLLVQSNCDIYCMYICKCISFLGETKHWVCTCSLKGSSAVMVIDSMALSLSLNNSTLLQISKVCRVPNCNSTLEICTVSVQQQKGSLDCGAFAVAYAVEVCLGNMLNLTRPKWETIFMSAW